MPAAGCTWRAAGIKAPPGTVSVYNLDTLELVGEIPNVSAHGAAVSSKSNHGFASSKPVAMWDTKTMAMIKTIDVDGGPDGILHDAFNDRVYTFSHRAPNATVINAVDGTVAGTIDLGGAPEQAASDGQGKLYVDIEDKDNIAVVDAKTMTVTAHYDLAGKGGTCAGLAMDVKNQILFATCRNPQTMVILNAGDGKIVTTLPIGQGTDGAVFNPSTMEAFSSHGDGTLTIVKENSPASFAVEQTVQTIARRQDIDVGPEDQPRPADRRGVRRASHASQGGSKGRTWGPRADGAGFVFDPDGRQVSRH